MSAHVSAYDTATIVNDAVIFRCTLDFLICKATVKAGHIAGCDTLVTLIFKGVYIRRVNVCSVSLKACPTLCNPTEPTTLLCPWNSPGKNYWSGLPRLPPGDLSHPGIEPTSHTSPALAGGSFTTSTIWEAQYAFININFLPYFTFDETINLYLLCDYQ